MERLVIGVADSLTVIVENASGSLRVKGWNRNEVRADADGRSSLIHQQTGDKIIISCQRDCYLRIPNDAALIINDVSGELFIKSMDASIEIQNAGGNLNMKDIVEANINQVGGNLSINRCDGDVEVGAVGGNADLRDVEGSATIGRVSGNFSARGEMEALKVVVDGNAQIRIDPDPEGTFQVGIAGNLDCRISEDASAEVVIHSDAGDIRVKSPKFSGKIKGEDYTFSIGDGDSDMQLSAGGKVYLRTFSEVSGMRMEFEFNRGDEFSDLAEDISEQVNSQLEEQMGALNEKLSKLKFGGGFKPSSGSRATILRAERKLETAQRRLERRAEAAQKRAERNYERSAQRKVHKGKKGFVRFASSFNENESVGDDERRMVLEMVQNKKISVEDAETLLAAMEGQPIASPPAPKAPAAESAKKPDMPETPKAAELPKLPKEGKNPKSKLDTKVKTIKKPKKVVKTDKKAAKK